MISAPGIEDVCNYTLSLVMENEETGEIIVPDSNVDFKINVDFGPGVVYTSLFNSGISEWRFFDSFSNLRNGEYKVYLCTYNKSDVTDIKKFCISRTRSHILH